MSRWRCTYRQCKRQTFIDPAPAIASPSFSMRFRGIFHGRTSAKLAEWIYDAIHSGLVFLARFARVLRRDIDAVCNAIDLPWSNGQAEGQINRLKTIKRAMYGRAGSELLRARMMPIKLADLHTK